MSVWCVCVCVRVCVRVCTWARGRARVRVLSMGYRATRGPRTHVIWFESHAALPLVLGSSCFLYRRLRCWFILACEAPTGGVSTNRITNQAP